MFFNLISYLNLFPQYSVILAYRDESFRLLKKLYRLPEIEIALLIQACPYPSISLYSMNK